MFQHKLAGNMWACAPQPGVMSLDSDYQDAGDLSNQLHSNNLKNDCSISSVCVRVCVYVCVCVCNSPSIRSLSLPHSLRPHTQHSPSSVYQTVISLEGNTVNHMTLWWLRPSCLMHQLIETRDTAHGNRPSAVTAAAMLALWFTPESELNKHLLKADNRQHGWLKLFKAACLFNVTVSAALLLFSLF